MDLIFVGLFLLGCLIFLAHQRPWLTLFLILVLILLQVFSKRVQTFWETFQRARTSVNNTLSELLDPHIPPEEEEKPVFPQQTEAERLKPVFPRQTEAERLKPVFPQQTEAERLLEQLRQQGPPSAEVNGGRKWSFTQGFQQATPSSAYDMGAKVNYCNTINDYIDSQLQAATQPQVVIRRPQAPHRGEYHRPSPIHSDYYPEQQQMSPAGQFDLQQMRLMQDLDRGHYAGGGGHYRPRQYADQPAPVSMTGGQFRSSEPPVRIRLRQSQPPEEEEEFPLDYEQLTLTDQVRLMKEHFDHL